MDAFLTPILLVTFNRLDTTKIVFDSIRQVKPSRLYISSDGPRNFIADEKSRIIEIRQWLIQNIDWKCDLKTLFRDKNLGCKYGVATAIDWFFESEEYGIVLEDDTVPNLDFFYFQEHCLLKYKHEPKVMMITGTNFLDKVSSKTYPYFFSNYSAIWGWGTWRSAWKLYDREMSSFDEQRLQEILNQKRTSNYIVRTLINQFRVANNPSLDTWDYQWMFSCIFHNGLCITPRVNLVQNIGVIGSHTQTKNNYHFRKTGLFPSEIYNSYLPEIEVNTSYDKKVYSQQHYRNKLHWVFIVYLLKQFKLYNYITSLKRNLNMLTNRYFKGCI